MHPDSGIICSPCSVLRPDRNLCSHVTSLTRATCPPLARPFVISGLSEASAQHCRHFRLLPMQVPNPGSQPSDAESGMLARVSVDCPMQSAGSGELQNHLCPKSDRRLIPLNECLEKGSFPGRGLSCLWLLRSLPGLSCRTRYAGRSLFSSALSIVVCRGPAASNL